MVSCNSETWNREKITDPTTGLQGLNWKTFLFYSKYNNFDDKYPDANMLMQMLLLGFRVREIPAVMHVRTAGMHTDTGSSDMHQSQRDSGSDACQNCRCQYAFRP